MAKRNMLDTFKITVSTGRTDALGRPIVKEISIGDATPEQAKAWSEDLKRQVAQVLRFVGDQPCQE